MQNLETAEHNSKNFSVKEQGHRATARALVENVTLT